MVVHGCIFILPIFLPIVNCLTSRGVDLRNGRSWKHLESEFYIILPGIFFMAIFSPLLCFFFWEGQQPANVANVANIPEPSDTSREDSDLAIASEENRVLCLETASAI